jgi:hypothetical protein
MSERTVIEEYKNIINKLMRDAINNIITHMSPIYITNEAHTRPIGYDGMSQYFDHIIKPVVTNIFNLHNYNLARELKNVYPDMFNRIDLTAAMSQTVKINTVCKKIQNQMLKFEEDYVLNIGRIESFYRLREECFNKFRDIEFNDTIYQQMHGRTIADIRRSEAKYKQSQVVYSHYISLRQLYNFHPTKPYIRCYEDYNGCVDNMKSANLDNFIRPGYTCVSSPDLKLLKNTVPESMVESIVNEFNQALLEYKWI